MTPDYRAMCAELVAALRNDAECAEVEHYDLCNMTAEQMRRAADLLERLAQPEPQGPTDEELVKHYDRAVTSAIAIRVAVRALTNEDRDAATVAGLRAVLARWGRLAAAPVPLSERLPGPEDCDEQGRCWLGGHQMGNGTPTWLLGYPAWAERFPDVHRFWLPAHALPTPEAAND